MACGLCSHETNGDSKLKTKGTITHYNELKRLCVQGSRKSFQRCLAIILVLSRSKKALLHCPLIVAAFLCLYIIVIMCTWHCHALRAASCLTSLLFPLHRYWVTVRQVRPTCCLPSCRLQPTVSSWRTVLLDTQHRQPDHCVRLFASHTHVQAGHSHEISSEKVGDEKELCCHSLRILNLFPDSFLLRPEHLASLQPCTLVSLEPTILA
jgi:hypothetical protein